MNTSATPTEATDRRAHAQLRVDYFLHPSFYDSPDKLHRARVLALTLCAIITISALIALILVLTPVHPYIRKVGIPFALGECVVFTVLLFKFKRDGSYDLCSNIAIWVTLLAIAAATFLTGGMTNSPIAQLLAISPLLAYFFGGIRPGSGATIFIGLLIAITLLLELNGQQFPQIAEAMDLDVARALLLLIGTIILSALAFFYEYTAAMLREERDKEHWKVMQLAQTDSLTGLANRRVFDSILNECIEQYHTNTKTHPFALCYLDLDGFKAINDRHGHDVGDQVLRAISIRLRSSLRGSDIIGRQGGDEFMLMLDQLSSSSALKATAQRFLKIITEPIETSAGLLNVGGSFGFAVFPYHGVTADALKKSADAAMYTAKHTRTEWYVADLDRLRSITSE